MTHHHLSSCRVLVTGGAGFIGSHLVEHLVRGNQVTVIDNLSRGRSEFVPPEAELITGDVCDQGTLWPILERFDPHIIFHLAGIHFIPECEANPEATRNINAGGTRCLLDGLASKARQLKRLVLASTAAIYKPSELPHTEDDPVSPQDVYGHSKLAAEHLVSEFASRGGTGVAIARLFNVYGSRETNPHFIPAVVGQLPSGVVRVGDLSTRRDYVHVSDAVQALVALAGMAAEGTTIANVGTGFATSGHEVLAILESLWGRSIEKVTDTSRLRRSDRAVLVANPGRLEHLTAFRPQRCVADGLKELLVSERGGLPK